jgi:hypothetical protein
MNVCCGGSNHEEALHTSRGTLDKNIEAVWYHSATISAGSDFGMNPMEK